ncbi:WDR25-like protein [Mya arenaria]|uniref:WDR25-like protein n=1 Tax=Mya arenaria TaxID=6604 RepID=A0ABY7FDD6_MYAAR|nr:WDR25-like protein [Mya arenaria]
MKMSNFEKVHYKSKKAMESLQQYCSDSDESNQNVDEDLSQVNDSSEKPEYFGLFSSDLSENYDRHSKALAHQCSDAIGKTSDKEHEFHKNVPSFSKVTVGDETVSIDRPQSSFWNDIQTSDVKVDINNKEKASKRTWTESKKSKYDIKKKSCNVDYGKSKSIQTVNNCGQIDFSRKIYYIHSKITPMLHTKTSRCRIPFKVEWTNPGHQGVTNRIEWNIPSYSHLLVSCSLDTTVKVWSMWSQLEPCVRQLRVHDRAVRDVQWSGDGRQLLSAGYDKIAAITDVEKGNAVCRFHHPDYVTCSRFHPILPQQFVTGTSSCITLWDSRTADRPIRTLTYKDKFGQVQDVVFSRDGSQLFSCSDLVQGYNLGFDISPDGGTVYSASSDGQLYCYDFQSGRHYRTLSTGLDVVVDVACHPVLPSTLATCAWDGTVQVWH